VDRVVRTLGHADTAVDALVGDRRRHVGSRSAAAR
jgi:hypothetical protein